MERKWLDLRAIKRNDQERFKGTARERKIQINKQRDRKNKAEVRVVSTSAFLVFFHAFSYSGVCFHYSIQHLYPLLLSPITS